MPKPPVADVGPAPVGDEDLDRGDGAFGGNYQDEHHEHATRDVGDQSHDADDEDVEERDKAFEGAPREEVPSSNRAPRLFSRPGDLQFSDGGLSPAGMASA